MMHVFTVVMNGYIDGRIESWKFFKIILHSSRPPTPFRPLSIYFMDRFRFVIVSLE